MTEPFIGQIVAVAFDFEPQGWARCNGQLLETTDPLTNEEVVLFQLLGYTYGGQGNFFALPDLRGRVPIHINPATSPSPDPDIKQTYQLGQKGGKEQVELEEINLPPHKHTLKATSAESDCNMPDSSKLLALSRYETYGDGTADIEMHPDAIASSTGTEDNYQGHENRQPYLTLNFLIALEGKDPRV